MVNLAEGGQTDPDVIRVMAVHRTHPRQGCFTLSDVAERLKCGDHLAIDGASPRRCRLSYWKQTLRGRRSTTPTISVYRLANENEPNKNIEKTRSHEAE